MLRRGSDSRVSTDSLLRASAPRTPEKPKPSPYAATADTYMSVPHEVVSSVWLTRLATAMAISAQTRWYKYTYARSRFGN